MKVYIYAADIYCKDCGEAICDRLDKEGKAPPDHFTESMYDSDEYPKGPYPDGGGKSDSPQHCGSGPNCLNAIEFDCFDRDKPPRMPTPSGRPSRKCWQSRHKIGAWLENELTTDGIVYLQEAIQEGGEVAELWADFYRDYDLQLVTKGD